MTMGAGSTRRASPPPLPHQLDQLSHMLRRRFGYDAVAEVEDERPLAEPVQDARGCRAQAAPAGDQELRVEVALHAGAGLQVIARPFQRHAGIEAEPLC